MQAQPGNYLVWGGEGTGEVQLNCYHNSTNCIKYSRSKLSEGEGQCNNLNEILHEKQCFGVC